MVPVLSRWSPTDKQRELISKGADIYLELSTFGNPLQPIRISISDGKLHNDWVRVCLFDMPAKTKTEIDTIYRPDGSTEKI